MKTTSFQTRYPSMLGMVCLMTASLLPISLTSQSLFETAKKLDSLYRGIDSNKEAPRLFFEELKVLYRLDEITPDNIKHDFDDNHYLSDEVDRAFFQLSLQDAMVVDSIAKLEAQKDTLYSKAIRMAEIDCKPRLSGQLELTLFPATTDSSGAVVKPVRELPKPCGIELEIQELAKNRSLKNLGAIWQKSENQELKRQLFEIQQKIYAVENEIKKLNEESESILQLSAEVGGGIPFRSEDSPAASAISPIILQAQVGGGSVSSSIIDGASKWIAERMREELSIAFFDRFEYWVEGKNIRLLFPNSFSALKSSLTTDYGLMIQIFKTAFEKDLKHLPFNLTNFLESEIAYKDTLARIDDNILKNTSKINELNRKIAKYEEMFADLYVQHTSDTSLAAMHYANYNFKRLSDEQIAYFEKRDSQFYATSEAISNSLYELYDQEAAATSELRENEMLAKDAYKALKYVLFTVKAIRILSEGEHPNTLLSYLNENIDELFPQAGNVKPALLVMDVISRSLVSANQENSNVWLGMNELYKLKSNRQLREFYFGLVYQEIRQSLRRERSQLELELAEAIENETSNAIYSNQWADRNYQASLNASEALFEYDAEGNYIFKTLDRLIASEALDTALDINAKSALRAKLEPFFNKIEELDSLNFEEFNKVAKGLEDATARFKATSEVAAYLEKNPNTPADTVWRAISPDIYGIPTEVMNSLYDDYIVPYYYEWMTNPQKDSVVDLSKQLLKKRFDERTFLVEKQDKSLLFGAVQDFMLMHFNWYFLEGQKSILLDSVTMIVEDALMEESRQDSVELIAEGMEKSPPIQRLYLQLGRLDNYHSFIDTLLLGNKRNFGDIVNGFLQFANRMDNINGEFQRLKAEGKANLGTHEFIFLMKNSVEALYKIYEIALPNDPSTLGTIKGLSSNLLDAYAAVLEKDYDAVVMNIIPVADSLLELSYRRKVDALRQLKEANDSQDTTGQDEIVHKILNGKVDQTQTPKKEMDKKLKKQLRKIFKDPELDSKPNEWETQLEDLLAEKENKVKKMHEIFKYGAFLAAVVESKNSDEIKSAIRAVALPAGSYSIKRRSFRNINLNAFPGITGGLELATNDVDSKIAPNFGFTAPIGLAVSWGYKSRINGLKYYTNSAYRRRVENSEQLPGNRFRSGHSGSLFFPLIDLGAVVLFRLDGSSEALPDDVNFQQIFSPGIMYAHGLPDLPISIMGGMQVSPQLRKIGEEKANAFRFNVSLVVDLPMANFYTRARQK